MSNRSKRYTEEFKIEAVRQMRELSAYEVAKRLGIATDTLYRWGRQYKKPPAQREEERSQSEEIRRLKAELQRVTEERDILKKATAYFAKGSR
jgi:transposase